MSHHPNGHKAGDCDLHPTSNSHCSETCRGKNPELKEAFLKKIGEMADKRKKGRNPNTPRNFDNNRNGKGDDYKGLYLSMDEISHCRKIRFAEGRGACFKCGNFFSPNHKCNASTAERTKWVNALRTKMKSGDTTPMFPLLKPKADRNGAHSASENAALVARLNSLETRLAQCGPHVAANVAAVDEESKTFDSEAWMSAQIGSLPEAQQREVLLWTLKKKVGRVLGRAAAASARSTTRASSPAPRPHATDAPPHLEPHRISSEPDAPTNLSVDPIGGAAGRLKL